MTCSACEARTPDGINLCHECTTLLEKQLGNLPHVLSSMYASLANLNSRQSVGSGGGEVRQSPVNLTLSDYLSTLDTILTGWTRELCESMYGQHGAGVFGRLTRDRMIYAGTLLANVNTIRKHEWAADLLNELEDITDKIMWSIDTHATVIVLGSCTCGGTYKARGRMARCTECGTRIDTADLKAQRVHEVGVHVDKLPVIVRALNKAGYKLKLTTAYKWVERGKLAPYCDIQTRKEGHSASQVLTVMQSMFRAK